jgi:hypothetical protein
LCTWIPLRYHRIISFQLKITKNHNIIRLLGFQKKCLKCTKVPKMPKMDESLRSAVNFIAQSSTVEASNQDKINSVPYVSNLL